MKRRYKQQKHIVQTLPLMAPPSDPTAKFFSCAYINGRTGIRHETLNISAASAEEVTAKIDLRCPREFRMSQSGGEMVDSLQVWEQAGIVVREITTARLPIVR